MIKQKPKYRNHIAYYRKLCLLTLRELANQTEAFGDRKRIDHQTLSRVELGYQRPTLNHKLAIYKVIHSRLVELGLTKEADALAPKRIFN